MDSSPSTSFEPGAQTLSDARRRQEFDGTSSSASRGADELEHRASRGSAVEARESKLVERNARLAEELEAIRTTLSWRITRPLRTVRRTQLRIAHHRRGPSLRHDRVSSAPRRDLDLAFADRVAQAADALHPAAGIGRLGPDDALVALEAALHTSPVPDRAKAWLSLVAADGRFPGEESVETLVRMFRMDGSAVVCRALLERYRESVERGRAPATRLDVRRGRVVVDVTHTASCDVHTGIQRVVREIVTHWIERGLDVDLVHFNSSTGAPKRLAHGEYQRMTHWREHLGRSGARLTFRIPEEATGDVVVPWQSRLVLPELASEPERCTAYRALASASVLRSLSIIGYDLIPVIAPETVAEGMSSNFAQYLSLVKHADRLSAISRTSAAGFRSFGAMAASEGLRGPSVAVHSLPTEVPSPQPGTVEAAREELGVGDDPLVLVVGSHEPRKNHVAVLEAAERLWRGGATFDLLFLGGSGWKSERFDELAGTFAVAGRHVSVRKRCTEDELWAAYSLARFSVFPSLLEGFGLPVAESLAMGTPVIASNYGSTAEVADGGGCLLVNPRDVDALTDAMARLLEDDQLLDRLRHEAAARPKSTWENYAADVWSHLVG